MVAAPWLNPILAALQDPRIKRPTRNAVLHALKTSGVNGEHALAYVAQRMAWLLGQANATGHEACEQALSVWLDTAVLVGRALMEARPQVPLGQWTAWLEKQGLSRYLASRYWRAAKHEEALRAAGALSHRSGLRFLKANQLGTGLGTGRPALISTEVREKAITLVRDQGLSQRETAQLLEISETTIRRWLNPDTERASHRKSYHKMAAARAADLDLQNRDAARQEGGDFEKAYEYLTKLDQILGRAGRSATTAERRQAAIQAHKHRDRAMDALLKGLVP